MFEAHWQQLDSDSSVNDSSFAPCPRRFHVTGVVYVRPAVPSAGPWRRLLVVFGGKTNVPCPLMSDPSPSLFSCGSSPESSAPVSRSPAGNTQQAAAQHAAEERYLGGVPFVFDVAAMRWLRVRVEGDPLYGAPEPRAYHAAAVHNNQLVICGGKTTSAAPLNAATVLGDVWTCTLSLPLLGREDDHTIIATWSRLDVPPAPPRRSADDDLLISRSSRSSRPSSWLMCYHTCVLVSSSLLVCCGGNDGKRWDDTIRVFNMKTNEWDSRHTAAAKTTIRAGLVVPNPAGCDCSWPEHQFCVHSSKTLRPVLFRKLLASQQQQQQESSAELRPSLPPREGHSMISLPRGRSASGDAVNESLFMFGGEVALTTFNTLFKLSAGLEMKASQQSTEWSILSGGGEYPHTSNASPPRQHACFTQQLTGSDVGARVQPEQPSRSTQEAQRVHHRVSSFVLPASPEKAGRGDGHLSPPAALPTRAIDSSGVCAEEVLTAAASRMISISESPPRHWTNEICVGGLRSDNDHQRGSSIDSQQQQQQQGGPQPEHRAFHTAWPSGSSGMLVYGGVCRGGQTVMSSLRRFDCIVGEWVDVVDPQCRDHPGPRASCPAATQPEPESPYNPDAAMCCAACGAPMNPCFLVGGETTSSSPTALPVCLVMDVWALTLHYRGCNAVTKTPKRDMYERRAVHGRSICGRSDGEEPRGSPARCFAGLALGATTPPLPLTPPPRKRPIYDNFDCADNAPAILRASRRDDTAVRPPPVMRCERHAAALNVSLLPLKLLIGMYIKEHMPHVLEQQRQKRKASSSRNVLSRTK
jgi:hypothetical protein